MSNNFFEIQLTDKAKLRIKKSAIVATIVNENDDVDVEQRKNKIFLKEFKFYLEVCRKPRGKLKDVRVEAVRAGFKQCYTDKNFADIILVGDRIPQNLLTEDEILLQYYDIASSKV